MKTTSRKTVSRFALAPLVVAALAAVAFAAAAAGERAFSWSVAPAQGDFVAAKLKEFNLGKYLENCQINRPEILREVKASLDAGKFYRQRTRDQRGKPALITVNVNPDYQLRIVTHRDETCEVCGGTGSRRIPTNRLDRFTGGLAAGLRCYNCKGDGILEQETREKYFVLSPEDFEDSRAARAMLASKDFEGAPEDTALWVERLVSKDPRERLAACEWLDKNYVRVGGQFTAIDPMLRKARYHEANDKEHTMVWQFWAGRDVQGESRRAFYRVYANTRSGKITEKGFYPQK